MNVPDLTTEVLAWRDWKVTAYGDLISRNSHAVWHPGPNRAICHGPGSTWYEKDHPAPQEECGCGFYGKHEPDGLWRSEGKPSPGAFYHYMSHNTVTESVHGLFKAWGQVVVHNTGIRAEWVELLALVHPDPPPAVKRAGGYYDVPIFPDDEAALSYADEKGFGFAPEEFRPEFSLEEDFTAFQVALKNTWNQQGAQLVRFASDVPEPETRELPSVLPAAIAATAIGLCAAGALTAITFA